MVRKSRVGITGVSADRSWRTSFNLPVAQGLAGLELANVASASQSTAGEAAKVFRATPRCADGKDLIKGPAVHIVTIAVRVSEYRELVLAALLAGKHTYFEWPLGRNRAEMQELTTTAKAVGMRANIGSQSPLNPAKPRAIALLSSGQSAGRLRPVLSSTVVFGPSVGPEISFGADPANGCSPARPTPTLTR